ncbi:MAG: hypothetical protein NZM28_10945, partial [Fimbriimonadales bacterium]|nr:hypothetical protein [Fimbriimonadales bacterium]
MHREFDELDATHAAAQVPASSASPEAYEEAKQETHEEQVEVKSPAHSQPPSETESGTALQLPSPLPEPYRDAAPFWHMPLEPGVFYDTPLIAHQQLADAERVVLQLESYLRNAGYEVEAVELRKNYTQWVKIPASQYEWLRHELEPLRKERHQELQQAQKDLEQAQIEFTKAMAAAKIPFPEPPKSKKRGKTPSAPEPVSPQLVERALNADFASDEEVCGEQGVAPVSSRGSRWTELGQWFFELFAPLAAGLLLGVNLGVITGLLSLEVLQRGESLWLVALAAVIGLFVEKLVGNTAYSLASSAAQASERREGIDSAAPFPTMRSTWRVAFFVVVVGALTIAIATVDALGLHMLYQERVQEAQLTGGGGGEQVPLWVFFIAGLIISAPYIVYKAVKGWREPEIRQREARVRYLHWKHVERRREEPAVQHAFEKAGEVEALSKDCARLTQELERIEARLDAARTECIGSTQKFREYWDSLIAWLSKERAPYAPESARRNGQFRRSSARGETLL